MPSSNSKLRKKFMSHHSDGIDVAESIIINNGGTLYKGIINIDPSVVHGEVREAIEFLVHEWDYCWDNDFGI